MEFQNVSPHTRCMQGLSHVGFHAVLTFHFLQNMASVNGANLMTVTSLRLLLFFVDSVILHSPFRQRTDTWLAPIAFGGI